MKSEFISRKQLEDLRDRIHARQGCRSEQVDSMILRQIYLYLGLKEDYYGTGCIVKEENEIK